MMFTVDLILVIYKISIVYKNGQDNMLNTFINILESFMATLHGTTILILLFRLAFLCKYPYLGSNYTKSK